MAKQSGKVAVVGLGYAGLPTAVCFAGGGMPTIGLDVNQEKVMEVAKGQPPFVEEGLKEKLAAALRKKRLA